MFCGSQAAAFYPTLFANDYVPDSYLLAGTVEAGLRKCRFGGLPAYLFRRLQSVMNAAAEIRCTYHPPYIIFCVLKTSPWMPWSYPNNLETIALFVPELCI